MSQDSNLQQSSNWPACKARLDAGDKFMGFDEPPRRNEYPVRKLDDHGALRFELITTLGERLIARCVPGSHAGDEPYWRILANNTALDGFHILGWREIA